MTEQTEPTNGKAALDSFAANATEMAPNGEQVTPEDWTQFERNDIQAALSARHVTPEWFKDKLPPERFLLTQLPRQGAETEAPGVMPEGDVCMLIGEGGVGKTWLAIQLALSVATGKAWFGAFHVPNPGPVLLMRVCDRSDRCSTSSERTRSAVNGDLGRLGTGRYLRVVGFASRLVGLVVVALEQVPLLLAGLLKHARATEREHLRRDVGAIVYLGHREASAA